MELRTLVRGSRVSAIITRNDECCGVSERAIRGRNVDISGCEPGGYRAEGTSD